MSLWTHVLRSVWPTQLESVCLKPLGKDGKFYLHLYFVFETCIVFQAHMSWLDRFEEEVFNIGIEYKARSWGGQSCFCKIACSWSVCLILLDGTCAFRFLRSVWFTQEAESAQLVQGADLGLRGADWRKQVAAVTAGSRLGAVLVVAGRASSKNVFLFGIVVHCMITWDVEKKGGNN